MKLITYIKNYSTIFVVDLTISIGLHCLWNKGYKCLASTASLCCIGGSYLYCRLKSRNRVSSNQVIIITGCDSGLGYSLALHCRQLGATVIASVLQIDGLGANQLKNKGVIVYPLDVTKIKSVEHFANSVKTVFRQKNLVLQCLINNAAVMIFGEFEWQTDEQLRNQVEVNLLGTMRITRELMPMIRAHFSRIIVISSHCNIQPIPGVAAYSGTKAALNAWATAVRMELKKYGVKVVCFIPGSFVSESNILARQAEHFDAMKRSMSEEAKTFYGDYFARYSQYFASVAQGTNLEKLQDSGIYEVFEGALLDKYPSAVYKYMSIGDACKRNDGTEVSYENEITRETAYAISFFENESWRYFVYHALFKVMPTCLRDSLVQKFVQGPSWTKRVNKSHEFEKISGSLDLKGQAENLDASGEENKGTKKL